MQFHPPFQPSAILAPNDSRPSLHILVVDDDALFRELISRQLEVCGHSATTASCARGALTELEARHFHLLITDWRMRDIDGCELVRKVRRLGKTLPIILYSGWLDHEPLPSDVALELAGTLQKPALVNDMMWAIRSAV